MVQEYFKIDFYQKVAQGYIDFILVVLKNFSKYRNTTKHIIISNFIAKSSGLLTSIFKLWELGSIEDGWMLYRCLTDRLFHLYSLNENNDFDIFEKWSFIKQYEMRNKAQSCQEIRYKLDDSYLKTKKEEKERYNELKKMNITWKRPDPEAIAKKMDLKFLYDYGYDIASTSIHPMATDGQVEFDRLLYNNHKSEEPVLLSNSCLIANILTYNGLNASDLLSARVISDFLDEMRNSLKSGHDNFMTSLSKIMMNENIEFCKAK